MISDNRHLKSVTILSTTTTTTFGSASFTSNNNNNDNNNNNNNDKSNNPRYTLFEEIKKNNKENLINLNRILNILSKIINYKEMNEKKKFCVQPNVDTELDEKREIHSNIAELLKKLSEKEIDNFINISEFIIYLYTIYWLLIRNTNGSECKPS